MPSVHGYKVKGHVYLDPYKIQNLYSAKYEICLKLLGKGDNPCVVQQQFTTAKVCIWTWTAEIMQWTLVTKTPAFRTDLFRPIASFWPGILHLLGRPTYRYIPTSADAHCLHTSRVLVCAPVHVSCVGSHSCCSNPSYLSSSKRNCFPLQSYKNGKQNRLLLDTTTSILYIYIYIYIIY